VEILFCKIEFISSLEAGMSSRFEEAGSSHRTQPDAPFKTVASIQKRIRLWTGMGLSLEMATFFSLPLLD